MKLKDVYLLVYNTLQAALWVQCTGAFSLALIRTNSLCESYSAALYWAKYAQAISCCEVVHAAIGLAGGGVAPAFLQALGRGAVLFGVLPYVTTVPCYVRFALLASWALGDVVRYSFYIGTILGGPPGWLLWLRYTAFIVLYPIGMIGEALTYYTSLGEVSAIGLHKVTMPNAWNFSFDFGVWNRGVLLLYPYFCMTLYGHMLQQRKKKLGKATTNTSNTTIHEKNE